MVCVYKTLSCANGAEEDGTGSLVTKSSLRRHVTGQNEDKITCSQIIMG